MAVHFLITIIYSVITAAAAAALYRFMVLPGTLAIGAGMLGFLCCGLGHMMVATALRMRRLAAAQAMIRDVVTSQGQDLADTQHDLLRFKQLSAETNERRHDALLTEVKLLQTLLSQVIEKRHVKALAASAKALQAPNDDAGPAALSEDEIFGIMRNALHENRVDLHLQPIVQLPSRRPWTYECFSRVRDDQGDVIYPSSYLDIAAEHGLIGTLDNLLLFRCIQMIRALGHRRPGVRFFFNISSASMADTEFFTPFVDFMLDNSSLANRLIFEFRHADLAHFSQDLLDDLGRLASAGYGFSIDHVDPQTLDPAQLARRFINFVKIEASALLNAKVDIHLADLKALLERHDITLIATKIEDERTVVDVLDLNIDYGQGFLFGEPRPSRHPAEAAA
ncbi:MAG: hypothetical protein Tsb0016_14160 [Sphingomonadales bacterium]